MSAIEFLLAPGMAPFTGAFAMVAGLVVIELVMMALGASLMGDGADADLGVDADAGFDLDGVDAHGLGAGGLDIAGPDIDGPDIDGPDIHGPDLDGFDGTTLHTDAPDYSHDTAMPTGIAGWLGFGEAPFILWLAGILTAFGLVGYTLQVILNAAFGVLLNPILAAGAALIPGLWIGRGIARALGRMIPKTESTAITLRSLGDRRGIVVQGTARRGHPAQARIRDGHGNLHYVRVEPVDDGVEIPAGTEVMIRSARGPVLGAIPIE